LVAITLAAAATLAAATRVTAETWTLELTRRESANPRAFDIQWWSYPQYFFVQISPQAQGRIVSPGNRDQTQAFKRIVKKEPKYVSEHPFRGVAKLGSQEFAFALDAVPPKSETQEAKREKEKAKSPAKEAKTDSAIAKLKEKLSKAASPPAPMSLKALRYNRLYFDFNRNGDLTDDKVVVGTAETSLYTAGAEVRSFVQIQFPRVDVTIDVGGTKLDYSFVLTGYGNTNTSSDFAYAQVSLNGAVRREGDITLSGKKHHVVLLDFNSNGRFDDEIKVSKNVAAQGEQPRPVYPEQGDMLLIDPQVPAGEFVSLDVTSTDHRYNVSKMIQLDGRFYDVKISPAGDKLTLTPSSAPLGSVTNPNGKFSAQIYGERGFLTIRGDQGVPAPVPEGQWKLLSYSLYQTERSETVKPAEKKPAEKKAESNASPWQALSDAIAKLFGGESVAVAPPRLGPRFTMVSAQATADYKAVKVTAGKTTVLPFGPPYKPTVTKPPYVMKAGEVPLEMSLVGSAGEICSNLMVDGGRPPKPQFTITDPKGKVVEQGSFEYG
jgi:hypothetical protein